jgi:hypothetical protein
MGEGYKVALSHPALKEATTDLQLTLSLIPGSTKQPLPPSTDFNS